MSYYVSVTGDVRINPEYREKIFEVMDKENFDPEKLLEWTCPFEKPEGEPVIYIFGYFNFHEDEDITNSMDMLAPYLLDGECVYCQGEDWEQWRYILRDGVWVYEDGCIIYDREPSGSTRFSIERDGITIWLTDEEIRKFKEWISLD